MRWTTFFICCLFVALAFSGGGAQLFASDLEPPRQTYPGEGPQSSDERSAEEELVEFCYGQHFICRKVCRLRFRDDQIGCSQQCESRISRCTQTGC